MTPCIPCRSHRAILQRTSWITTLLAIALLTVSLFGLWRLDFLTPGDLSPPHATLKRCSLCHSAFEGGLPNWLVEAVGQTNRGRDSDLCLKCHPRVAQARWPHNLSPEVLAIAHKGASLTPDDAEAIHQMHSDPSCSACHTISAPSCSVCHREHTGGDKAPVIRDTRLCNSCHRTAIAGFSVDHPGFPPVSPFRDRTSIDFDHASHFKKHFQGKLKEKAPEKCSACHQVQPATGQVVHANFNTACAACHADQIRGELRAGFKGFPVLNVPGLDTQTMATLGMDTGQWPELADGEISEFIRLLLRDDEEFNAALSTLRGRDLLDLKNLSAEEKNAVTEVVWSIKGFFRELLTEGHTAWARRFYGAQGLPAAGEVLGEINGGLAVDTLREAIGAWFPDLEQEWTRHEQGQPVVAPPVTKAEVVTAPDVKNEKPSKPTPGEDDGLLTGDTGDGLLDDTPTVASAKVAEGLLDSVTEDPSATATTQPPLKQPMSDEEWSRGGGWYRAGYALYYRPGGHGDRFLRTWLEHMRSLPDATVEPLRVLLTKKNAPGECNKCHLDEVNPCKPKALQHGSGSGSEGLEVKSLTHFSHKPHLNALRNNCQDCHQLETPATQDAPATTPIQKTKGFKPVHREVCVSCHTRDQAGEDCLQCHNYHARPQ
ncbi:MAG: MULTIHEME CYTC protein [Magnetococcales bacterium]|nr:MULTIHEME CYTC protein [Magnetococcales bacterium]